MEVLIGGGHRAIPIEERKRGYVKGE